MISSLGHVKLLDFGLGRRESDDAVTSLVGTPKYVAPEILQIAKGQRRDGYGKAIDYWSLGVMLYEMLVGNTPFEVGVRSRQDLYKKILGGRHGLDIGALLSQHRTLGIDASAATAIRGLLNRDPAQRFGGSQEPDGLPRTLLEHDFFREIDWVQLRRRDVPPPWQPSEAQVSRQLALDDSEMHRSEILEGGYSALQGTGGGPAASAAATGGAVAAESFSKIDGFTFNRRTAKEALGRPLQRAT